jgi:hypothetical protein
MLRTMLLIAICGVVTGCVKPVEKVDPSDTKIARVNVTYDKLVENAVPEAKTAVLFAKAIKSVGVWADGKRVGFVKLDGNERVNLPAKARTVNLSFETSFNDLNPNQLFFKPKLTGDVDVSRFKRNSEFSINCHMDFIQGITHLEDGVYCEAS